MFKRTTLKVDDSGAFGFVEKYEIYKYAGSQRVRALFGLELVEEKACVPEVIRDFAFTPLTETEVPVEGYLRAKKAIYSPFSQEIIVLGVEVKKSADGEIEGRTVVYSPDVFQTNTLLLRAGVFLLSDDVSDQMIGLVSNTFGDRAAFLRSRLDVDNV